MLSRARTWPALLMTSRKPSECQPPPRSFSCNSKAVLAQNKYKRLSWIVCKFRHAILTPWSTCSIAPRASTRAIPRPTSRSRSRPRWRTRRRSCTLWKRSGLMTPACCLLATMTPSSISIHWFLSNLFSSSTRIKKAIRGCLRMHEIRRAVTLWISMSR